MCAAEKMELNPHALQEEEDADPEIVKGLSGDEVDTSNIIEGGRRSRRGRPQQAPVYKRNYKPAADASDDEW